MSRFAHNLLPNIGNFIPKLGAGTLNQYAQGGRLTADEMAAEGQRPTEFEEGKIYNKFLPSTPDMVAGQKRFQADLAGMVPQTPSDVLTAVTLTGA